MVDVIIQNGVDEGSLLGLLEELSFSPPSITSASRSRSVCSSNGSINEEQDLDDKSSSVNSSNKENVTLDKNIGERDEGEGGVGTTCDKKDFNTTTTSTPTLQKDREDENQLLGGEEEEQQEEEQQEKPQLSKDESEQSQPEKATPSQQQQQGEGGSNNEPTTSSLNDVVLQLERLYPTVFNFINGGGKYKKQPKVPEMILLCDSYSSCSSSNASVTKDNNEEGKEVKRMEKQERNDTAADDDNESRVSKLTLPKDLCSISSLSTRTTRPRRSRRGRKLRRRRKKGKDGDGTTASKCNHKKQEDSKRRKRRLGVRNASTTSFASSSNDEQSIIVTYKDKKDDFPPPSPASGNENRASSMPIVLTIGGRTYEGTYSGDLGVESMGDGKGTKNDGGNEDDDSPFIPNGIGIIRFVNTDMYMGEMFDGEMNGEGTFMFGTNESDPPSVRQRVVMRGEFMNNLFWL